MMRNALKSTSNKIPQRPAKTYPAQHVMFVSDEIELVETLQIELSQKGFQVSIIHDGLRGLLAINRMKPDLVVISWSPPRLSGIDICQRLRTHKRTTAVILLTKEDNVEERIEGLNAGADDCLSLPFVKEEFLARIHANISHYQERKMEEPLLKYADLLLNRETREVFRGGEYIHLTAKEFNLLEYFMEHNLQVLTRAQILENVWGYDYAGSSNIIEVYIRYLRKKLGATPENRIIYTIRSVGYILREVS
ncbi:MAG: response regulator transcription factor [Cyanobacteria bacterium J06626_6]